MNRKEKRLIARPEREIILEFVHLGRGHIPEKEKLADELAVSFRTLKYKANKFKAGDGIGRKTRFDKGIPKKDPAIKTKLEFFAELAVGMTIDDATKKLKLTEHQGNMLAREYKKEDPWKAIRNAPQLKQLRALIKDIFRIDLALVNAEMNGSLVVKVDGAVISIPSEELNDIKTILAHCLQRDKMAEIDPQYRKYSKTDLMNVRLYYWKEELAENKNTTEFARLHRAVKPNTPEKQLDLKLVYAIIDRFSPGADEQFKIKIIKEEFEKLKID